MPDFDCNSDYLDGSELVEVHRKRAGTNDREKIKVPLSQIIESKSAAAVAAHDRSASAHGLGGVVGFDARTADGIWTIASVSSLSLPNPYPDKTNAPVHPSLLFLPEGWAGFRYWLAFTPYPDNDSDFENPCIAASNDGVNWVSTSGYPLVPKPASGFTSDPSLFMAPDLSLMYIVFRERAATNRLLVSQSSDGVSWSAPVAIVSGSLATQDFASPSIWWNGTGWTMISHNISASAPYPVQRSVTSGADIYTGWGSPVSLTLPPKASRQWWHSNFIRLPSGRVVGVISDDSSPATGGGGYAYIYESYDDGITFLLTAEILTLYSGKIYRCAICNRASSTTLADLVISDFNAKKLYRHEIKFGALDTVSKFGSYISSSVLAGAAKPIGIRMADNFSRADASSIGVSSSGDSYTAGGTWGILGGSAYPVTSGKQWFNSGSANHSITALLKGLGTGKEFWILARGVSDVTFIRVGLTSATSSELQPISLQVVSGGNIIASSPCGVVKVGDYLTVECLGAEVRVLRNGLTIFSYMVSVNTTATSVGFQGAASSSTLVQNLVVSVPA